jgi:putative stress-induced transcription regulator
VRAQPRATVEELDDARRLREAVYCLLRERIGAPSPADEVAEAMRVLNLMAARPALGDRLVVTPGVCTRNPWPGRRRRRSHGSPAKPSD